MASSKFRSQRKVSGGRYHFFRGKKKSELIGITANTKLGEKKDVRSRRTPGGNYKQALLSVKEINVAGKGKTVKTEILNVIENPANPNLVRRNIITKGAIVQTKLGKVRVTSRPGQEGSVNGVLVA